jgi:transposase
LKNDDFETHGQVSEFINAQYGKSYSQSGIHRLFKRLGVKLKTARPINYKQNKGALNYFKKKVKKSK